MGLFRCILGGGGQWTAPGHLFGLSLHSGCYSWGGFWGLLSKTIPVCTQKQGHRHRVGPLTSEKDVGPFPWQQGGDGGIQEPWYTYQPRLHPTVLTRSGGALSLGHRCPKSRWGRNIYCVYLGWHHRALPQGDPSNPSFHQLAVCCRTASELGTR